MHQIIFECEAITPMFLAGASRKDPELRPPSIKGALRFWWRAMNGHLLINDLRQKEAKIFGGRSENEGRSKIILRTRAKDIQKSSRLLKEEYRLDWRFDPRLKTLIGRHSGIGYLFYSISLSGNKRFFYREKTRFELIISSIDKKALTHAIASLWSLSFLGGIGARSRRGAGNFCVVDIKDKDGIVRDTGLEFYLREENVDNIADWLIKNYKIASNIVNHNKKTDFVCGYSNLSLSRIILSNRSFGSWIEALNDIGKVYQDFRTRNKKDIFGTSVFGLPRKHLETTDKNYSRRSSPIIIKTLKSNNQYHWLVLRMAGEFLPQDVVLKHRGKTQRPDYSRLDEFWHQLRLKNTERILYMPDKLKDLKERIVNMAGPSRIILFGSRARGDFNAISDIDIAVENAKDVSVFDELIGNIDIVSIERVDKGLKEHIVMEGVTI